MAIMPAMEGGSSYDTRIRAIRAGPDPIRDNAIVSFSPMMEGYFVNFVYRQPGAFSRLSTGGAVPWILSGILLIGMIATAWWGVGQQVQRDDARADLETAQQELLQTSSQTNSVAYRLSVTPDGPANASGTAFMPLGGSGVLSVVNLPQPEAGQTYQFWYFRDDSTPPIPGGTFSVGADGIGFMLIPADVGPVRGLGVSLEPEGGSEIPSASMLLQGSLGPARG